MAEAARRQEFERAACSATGSKRSLADGAPAGRRRPVGTADLIGVAVEGTDANAQVFQVRDGILAERQGFYLDNEGERELDEVAEEFLAEYY